MPSILFKSRPNPTCVYCRDTLKQSAYVCDCGAQYHADCWRELGHCATLGCDKTAEGWEPQNSDGPYAEGNRISNPKTQTKKPEPAALGAAPFPSVLVVGLFMLLSYAVVYCFMFLGK